MPKEGEEAEEPAETDPALFLPTLGEVVGLACSLLSAVSFSFSFSFELERGLDLASEEEEEEFGLR